MRRKWGESEIARLIEIYPNTPTRLVAEEIGRSIGQVYQKSTSLGIKKSAEYLASEHACRLRRGNNVCAAYRIQPGDVPWNKGIKFDSGGRSHETRFKPGFRGGKAAELYQPIGTERISKDGYIERKVNDDMPLQKRWRGVHLVAWEEINGPVPKGYAVTFKDGNKQNTALSNLELLSRADLMRRNTYHNYPKEVALLIQLRGAVSRQINKREKESA